MENYPKGDVFDTKVSSVLLTQVLSFVWKTEMLYI